MQVDRQIYCDLEQRLLLTLAAAHRAASTADLAVLVGIAESDAKSLMAALERSNFPVRLDADGRWCLANQWFPLDPNNLASKLGETRDVTRIECHASLSSTSDYLASQIRRVERPPSGTACFAEMQTAGRGRNGRRWESPPGSNLYFSFYREIPPSRAAWSGLSIALGVAIAETLRRLGAYDLQLKWPNDLVHRGAKVGGVLVDSTASAGGLSRVMVGVGLNISLPEPVQQAIDQPATDLAHVLGGPVDRSKFAVAALRAVADALSCFENEGLTSFLGSWARMDALAAQSVVVTANGRIMEGIACGIDGTGALQLRVGSDILRFISGEVTVRTTRSF